MGTGGFVGVRAAAVVVVLVGSVALAGCGSSSTHNALGSPPGTTAPSQPIRPLPHRDVTPQLLTVADLPTGWSVDNSPDTKSTLPACLTGIKAKSRQATGSAEARFVQGDFPLFQEHLGYGGTSAAAIATLKLGSSTLNRCTSFKVKGGGYTFDGTIGAMSFPKFGQQSEAWQMTLTAQGTTAGFVIVIVQKGPELGLFLYGDLGTPNTDDVTALVTKAVAKMPLH